MVSSIWLALCRRMLRGGGWSVSKQGHVTLMLNTTFDSILKGFISNDKQQETQPKTVLNFIIRRRVMYCYNNIIIPEKFDHSEKR